jgi:hypothetical protein
MSKQVFAIIALLFTSTIAFAQWTQPSGPGGPIYYPSGNVGIGTTSPAYPLDLVGNLNGVFRFRLYNQSTGDVAYTSMNFVNGAGNVGALFLTGSNTTNNNYGGANAFVLDNASNGSVSFATNDLVRMSISASGNVGIGTSVPTAKLDVNGDINVSGNINAKYQDIAEWVPSTGKMPPGTVVVISGDATNTVTPSSRPYDTHVAGVVSSQPGVILGVASESRSKIATTGRVKVRVDATAHPVLQGDLLVTSNRPGVAMVSEPLDLGGVKIHRPGTLIGKALEPLAGGEGEILVLLSLQ